MAKKKGRATRFRTYLAKARGGTTKDYPKKTTLSRRAVAADAVFYIETGKVKLTVLSPRGRKRSSPSWERRFLW